MPVCTSSEFFGLPVKKLHNERVKNADLLQCGYAVMNTGEGCVKAVKKIVNEWFRYSSGCAVRIALSHIRLSRKVIWLGLRTC